MDPKTSISVSAGKKLGLPAVLLLLFTVLAILFRNQFVPGYTLFSNDGPLGALMAQAHRVPAAFQGGWMDLNSIGFREGGAFPDITYALLWLLGPVGFSKFYAGIVLLILGLAAWCFFRQAGLVPIACLLGGLAAALNSGFFTAACWGVGTHPLTIAMNFLALAALMDNSSRRRWLRVALAGAAAGMGVMEGADIGAIFSLFVAAFAVYQSWTDEGLKAFGLMLGTVRVVIVAAFAAFLASHAITTLVGTQIKGVVGTKQDEQTKQQHWDFATQWSMPKTEAIGLIAPGIFGYRMDTPNGGNYWGAIGRDPNWDRYFASGKQGPPPGGFIRFGGGGTYAGVLVVLVAAWAVLQSFRKKDSVFSLANRRWIWFWFTIAAISMLLGFGRFAPFYRLLYAVPYFSTIRNPAKFFHVLNWAIVIAFAYGMHGLWRRYIDTSANEMTPGATLKSWWQRVRGFDYGWTVGCLMALAVAFVALLVYASSRTALETHLQEVQFDAAMAHDIAGFSLGQAGWALLSFAIAVGLVILIISGKFKRIGAKWGAIVLGLFLVIDLGRADQPWVITWHYQQKYASNPIIDKLRQQPYEHRVASLPRWFLQPQLLQLFGIPRQLIDAEQYLRQLYSIEWTQHHFLYYDIQSLDIIQMPRVPEDLAAFDAAMSPRSGLDLTYLVARHWQLTNTRYILAAAGFFEFLNQQFDPEQHRFRVADRFQIVPKAGIVQPTKLEELTAVPDTNGSFALFEFTGALPRAKLYTNWLMPINDQAALDEIKAGSLKTNELDSLHQMGTNDFLTLRILSSQKFDPAKTVLLAEPLAVSTNAAPADVKEGKVEFKSYAPKDIVLQADATAPSVLLLNDHYDPDWKVFVDSKSEKLLRCNYLMRGVYLPAGSHKVEFRFALPMNAFYVSVAAIGVGLLLCASLLVVRDPPASATISASAERQTKVPAERGS